jgi:AAA15 family ATPase/GTPase
MSEEELDNRFAEEVNRLWIDYNADISSDIAEAQQLGLANILHSVLSGDVGESQAGPAPSTDEAYARVSAFLKRQTKEFFPYILDSPETFARKYETESQIKTIVRQIDNIENRIEEVTAPKSRLEHLLQSMYSGNKRLILTEKEIRVEVASGAKIGLPALSSGEKQLFFICLAALRSGNHSLIVDEPELSMHVDWQTKLIASLRELNPDVQLIMATHSPEIMANIPDNQVFSL